MAKKKGVEDISNRTLASLLIVAIVISLGGTLFLIQEPGIVRITGAVTETDAGTLSAEVEQVTAINMTWDTIDFGTGRVQAGQPFCELNTSDAATAYCNNFTGQATGFQIENIGNMNVSLYVESTNGDQSFIGGSQAAYQWQANNVTEPGSCLNDTGGSDSPLNASVVDTWESVDLDGESGQYLCPRFLATDANDMIELDLRLGIPSDTSPGALSDTLTFTATTI